MSDIVLRTFEFSQQFEHYDLQTLGEIEERIKELPHILKYALIIHDQDIKEDGTPKAKHFHGVVVLSSPVGLPTIAKTLHVETQYVEKIKTTTRKAFEYLVHKNDLSKFQYNADNVLANFNYPVFITEGDKKQKLKDYIIQVIDGDIKEYNLGKHVDGYIYAMNKNKFDNAFKFRQMKLRGLNRNMETLFISGASGSGKTTFAKMLGNASGYGVYISSGGKNPLDDYKGEECIILDDIRDTTYELNDLLKLTDNNTDSLVGCRFYNKSIAECKLLIISTVQHINEMYKFSNEDTTQLCRRFPVWLDLTKDIVTTWKYTGEGVKYVIEDRKRNPIQYVYNSVSQSDLITKCNDLLELSPEQLKELNKG